MTSSTPTSGAAPLAAILLTFATGVLFTCLDTSAKYLVLSGMSGQFIAWVRFVEHAALALILLGAWRNPLVFRVTNWPLQILRGTFLFGSTFFNFQALQTLQLAQAMSIMFFSPMIITALSGPFLGEWAGWRRWMAVLAGFVGVLVITRPGFATFEFGHVLVLCAALSYSAYVLMTRHMAATESAESLVFYSALAPALLMAPTVPYTASMPADALHWLVLLSLGFYGGIGHWLLIKAYRLASTTASRPIRISR